MHENVHTPLQFDSKKPPKTEGMPMEHSPLQLLSQELFLIACDVVNAPLRALAHSQIDGILVFFTYSQQRGEKSQPHIVPFSPIRHRLIEM